jgi:hypothetical protein
VSTLFSFPVATFTASASLAIILMAHLSASSPGGKHVHHHHGTPAEPSALVKAAEKAVDQLAGVCGPVLRYDPIAPLSDGILISWRFTGAAVLLLALAGPFVLGVAGSACLNRRELAGGS